MPAMGWNVRKGLSKVVQRYISEWTGTANALGITFLDHFHCTVLSGPSHNVPLTSCTQEFEVDIVGMLVIAKHGLTKKNDIGLNT